MQIIAARPSLRTRAAGLAAAAAVACSFAFAGAADAQPVKNTGAKGCPVEHEDGRVTYVPVGTRVGLFKCGSDGEWHFGWLVDHLVAGDGGTTTGPVVNGTLAPVAAR
jgi:hypothetical protein